MSYGTVPDHYDFNGSDRLMLTLTRVARQQHWGSFGHVLQIEWHSLVDAERVQALIARMGRVHPVLTARLSGQYGQPRWVFRKDAVCPLRIVEILQPCEENRHSYIAELLRTTVDFERENPVSFHLLQQADGRSVLAVQFDHIISGSMAFGLIVDELKRLDEAQTDAAPPWIGAQPQKPLPSMTWKERWRYWKYLFQQRKRVRGKTSIQLVSPQVHQQLGPTIDWGPARAHCTRLSVQQTQAWRETWSRAIALPSASFSLLASVLRAAWKLRPEDRRADQQCLATSFGLDLRPRGAKGPIFENQIAVLPVEIMPDQLESRDQLVQTLLRGVREQIKVGVDRMSQAGASRYRESGMMGCLYRRLIQRHTQFHRLGWYGYLNELTQVETLCGQSIRDITAHVEPWPIFGLSIVGYEYRGSMHLCVASLPKAMSDDRVQAFTQAVMQDLFSSDTA